MLSSTLALAVVIATVTAAAVVLSFRLTTAIVLLLSSLYEPRLRFSIEDFSPLAASHVHVLVGLYSNVVVA